MLIAREFSQPIPQPQRSNGSPPGVGRFVRVRALLALVVYFTLFLLYFPFRSKGNGALDKAYRHITYLCLIGYLFQPFQLCWSRWPDSCAFMFYDCTRSIDSRFVAAFSRFRRSGPCSIFGSKCFAADFEQSGCVDNCRPSTAEHVSKYLLSEHSGVIPNQHSTSSMHGRWNITKL